MVMVTASSRGQIVMPGDIRRQLNITPGKKLLLKVAGDQAVIQPLPDDPIEAFCGIFSAGDSLTEALMDSRRQERERESAKTA